MKTVLIFAAKIFQFPALSIKMVKQKNFLLIKILLHFPILYNVMFFFRSLNFFFPPIIFVIDRKLLFFLTFCGRYFYYSLFNSSTIIAEQIIKLSSK